VELVVNVAPTLSILEVSLEVTTVYSNTSNTGMARMKCRENVPDFARI